MGTNIKILILEHDPNDLGLLQYHLKKSGLDITSTVVETKAAYEDALKSFKPDIILSDYSLPTFDGLSAFKIKQEVSPDTPFIIVSGTIGEENAVELIKMGVTDYTLKERMYQIGPKIERAIREAEERKQKEVALLQLKEREEQLQKILDLSLDVICTLDEEGRFVTVSAASNLVWGYSPEELIGKKGVDFLHEQDREGTLKTMADKRLKGIELLNYENRFIRKDGQLVTIFWSGRWDLNEKLFYGVARDATDIKKAEEEIRARERRFRTILQNSNDGYVLAEADGTIIERSPTVIKVFGLRENDDTSRLRMDLVHPEDLPLLQESIDQVEAIPDEKRIVEYRFFGPIDSSYRWIETTIHNQLQEPAVQAIVFNSRDISERKLAEIALRENEARLKEAQAIGHLGNCEINLNTGKIIWSDEMYRIFGVDKAYFNPNIESITHLIHPDDRDALISSLKRVKRFPKGVSTGFRVVRPNGEQRYVTSKWRTEYDAEGKPYKIFGVEQDITELKQAEIALERSEEKYRDLFNFSPIPKWVYDFETLRFLDVNEATVRQYGYSKDEFMNLTLLDILPKEDARQFLKLAKRLKDTNEHYQEIRKHVKKSGEEFYVDVQCNSIELNGKMVRIVLATDVSERMRYIQAVEEQNKKLREIAWTQSHVVRAPLARIMGLISLLDYPMEQKQTSGILNSISVSAHELDGIIRKIVAISEQVNDKSLIIEEKSTQ